MGVSESSAGRRVPLREVEKIGPSAKGTGRGCDIMRAGGAGCGGGLALPRYTKARTTPVPSATVGADSASKHSKLLQRPPHLLLLDTRASAQGSPPSGGLRSSAQVLVACRAGAELGGGTRVSSIRLLSGGQNHLQSTAHSNRALSAGSPRPEGDLAGDEAAGRLWKRVAGTAGSADSTRRSGSEMTKRFS